MIAAKLQMRAAYMDFSLPFCIIQNYFQRGGLSGFWRVFLFFPLFRVRYSGGNLLILEGISAALECLVRAAVAGGSTFARFELREQIVMGCFRRQDEGAPAWHRNLLALCYDDE